MTVDPEPLSEETIKKIEKGLEEIKNGRYYTEEEFLPNWGLSGVIGNLYSGSSEGHRGSSCEYLYLRDHSSFFFNLSIR
ncbi:hypothetical protein [Methanosarcina sp.]|uniref:hypothetical protein n=1 Tax=Methanosarcina sp. TaxID=2213 RepID=UPI002ABA5A42|nr:hypothetical protein [Methanosarcina sp.]MDY9925638.1 hypothetical protein [Methanosarcina sp.]